EEGPARGRPPTTPVPRRRKALHPQPVGIDIAALLPGGPDITMRFRGPCRAGTRRTSPETALRRTPPKPDRRGESPPYRTAIGTAIQRWSTPGVSPDS